MQQYHKIQTVFLRDPETNFKTLLEGEFSKPEFNYLKDVDWVWTEKIDGTNIRIMWNGTTVSFAGKTDNAQIPPFLFKVLQDTFTVELMASVFSDETSVCLYGEGYGKKIQKGGNYLSNRTDFILFDIKIGDWWLERDTIEEIADKLNVNIVPVLGIGSLIDAITMVKKGFTSTIAENTNYIAEGLIMKPVVSMFNRKGERIVTKLKYKDFKRD